MTQYERHLPHQGDIVLKGESVLRLLVCLDAMTQLLTMAGLFKTANLIQYHQALIETEAGVEKTEVKDEQPELR